MNLLSGKTYVAPVIAIMLLLISCNKHVTTEVETNAKIRGFTTYTILKNHNFCEQDKYTPISLSALYFTARFDSSSIYTTKLPGNQADINKLYGFSDNNAFHHQFSARFGWRWYKNALSLQAYVYNNGTWQFKDLGAIEIGKDQSCAILVQGDHYDFVLNGTVTTMPRASTTATAKGYKLYPYFGGDETAPHAIHIYIKEP